MRFFLMMGFFWHAYLTNPQLYDYQYSKLSIAFFITVVAFGFVWDIIELYEKRK